MVPEFSDLQRIYNHFAYLSVTMRINHALSQDGLSVFQKEIICHILNTSIWTQTPKYVILFNNVQNNIV